MPGGTTTFTRDSRGRLLRLATPAGVINYEYAESGEVTRIYTATAAAPALPVGDVRYAYDVFGRLLTVTVLRRDGADLAMPEVTRYEYTLLGNPHRVTLPNGVVRAYEYDYFGRLTRIAHFLPDGTPADLSNNVMLDEYTYTLGTAGRREAERETRRGLLDTYSTTTTSWSYDNLQRVTGETFDFTTDGVLDRTATYRYDLSGNRLSRATNSDGIGPIDETVAYTYDGNDRLITEDGLVVGGIVTTTNYSYGGVGNPGTQLTGKTRYQQGTATIREQTSYSYDVKAQLASVNSDRTENGKHVVVSATYQYDHAGTRIRENRTLTIDTGSPTTAATHYLVDALNPSAIDQVLEERDATTGLTNRTFTVGRHVIGQDDAAPGSGPIFYLSDGRNSTRAAVDELLSIAQTYDYDAYGVGLNYTNGVAPADATLVDRLFTSEEYDTALEMLHLRARRYDPSIGRFPTPDPVPGTREDPITQHRYNYAADNPIMFGDPTGRIFMAFDGTNNHENAWDPDGTTQNWITNVRKMYEAVPRGNNSHYHRGVGNPFDFPGIMGVIGGATGLGARQILNLALDEVRADAANGDTQIDIVGFSRGAAMSLEFTHMLNEEVPEVQVRFLGLFDTVGSFGLGGNGINTGYNLTPASNVRAAYHAIAFHEDRAVFPATNVRSPGAFALRPRQEAFRGVHSDIGGGWEPARWGLSNITLHWMIDNARRHNVQLDNRWAAANEAPNQDPTPNTLWPWILAGGFVTPGLSRPTIQQGQWYPLALSWYADDVDFRRVGVGLNEIQTNQVAWPLLHVAELAVKSALIGGRFGALNFAVGVIQLETAILQYLISRS